MNKTELQVHINKIVENINSTLLSKGKEYQKGENVFSNFLAHFSANRVHRDF